MSVRYTVHLYAAARESAAADTIDITADEPVVASELLRRVIDDLPGDAAWMGVSRLAVDDAYVAGDPMIDPAADIALIPPVSGG